MPINAGHLAKWWLLLCMLWLPLWAEADGTVLFLFDAQNDHYVEYVEQGERLLQQVLPDITVVRLGLTEAQEWRGGDNGRTLLISVGAQAARRAAGYKLPTLNTLLTRRSFEQLATHYDSPRSVVFVEQSLERQLRLIKSTLPQRDRLTVLLGSDTGNHRVEFSRLSQQLGVEMQFVTVAEDGDIDRLFADGVLADGTLLLLPDPQVVNRRTVKPLVLGSYRQGIALVGYSEALVKAGALMAVHSPPDALAAEMVAAAKNYMASGVLPSPRYASGFEVSVNYQLARALKISLPSESELKKRLEERLP